MSTPSKTLRQMEDTLHAVIESLIDSQEGFQQIGDRLHDETLRLYFLEESLTRAKFRGDLETVLHQEGVHDIHEHGTANGTALRIWASVKSKLGGGDHTLLATAEEAEDAAKAAYEEALSTELPLPVRRLLMDQAIHVENSHDFVKAARDLRRS
jgi:uncharacterized protein (TIGR02284 family)